jgi:transposase
MSRPNMRFVKMKSVEQQDIQAIHRVRSELMSQRIAKMNQIRGLVAEDMARGCREWINRSIPPSAERLVA